MVRMGPGQLAQLACIFEATACKPGNVHRFQDFDDLSYVDFLLSAAAIAPVFDRAPGRRVGATILDAIRATRQVVRTNSNLGMILLLAPLAAVPPTEALEDGLPAILEQLDIADARLTYEAIRLARPGGLDRAPEQDISQEPTLPLRDIMALAADHDRIAWQYANGFRDIFDEGAPVLTLFLKRGGLEQAIIATHLQLLAKFPDSLVARKRGMEEATEASRKAGRILEAGWPDTDRAQRELVAFDSWLRAEDHWRNPGTTADLVTASLFVCLRRGIITLPVEW